MSQTKNLKLNIHDDLSSEENFDSQTYLYDNWAKIDDYADTIEKKTSELDSTIAEQSSKISSLEADNETNKTNISGIQTKDTEQDVEITSIKEEQTTQNNNIQSNTTAINKNADDIEEINAKNEEQDEEIAVNRNEIVAARTSSVSSKTFENLNQRLDNIETDISNISNTSGHVYGIRRKISDNSSSSWERLFNSIGKTATATKNGGTVQNDFDDLAPWSEIKSCNYDLATGKIKAWYGDANFVFDGSNGDVFTYIPKTYWKIYQDDDYDYILLADYPKAGFTEIDSFYIGRYNGSVVSADGLLHSYSGLVPTTNKNISQFRTLAQALGDKFSLLDWRFYILQNLYLVEYANFNSQSMLGNGIQSRKNLKALVAETSTNRVIIGSSSGYYVGQIIRIGTSDSGTQIADARKITAIEDYDDGTVTGYAITFDGDAVNIAVDNYVCTMAQETGQCDTLGMKSGCLNNDGRHSVIYRGVENIFANIWQWVDGINIKDNVAYICKDHTQYSSNKFEDPYKVLAYTNATTNGWVKKLGFDPDEPFFRFPTETGGSSSTYMDDYYHPSTGNKAARVGGAFDNGSGAGMWCWDMNCASSFAYWYFGCRVLIDNQ